MKIILQHEGKKALRADASEKEIMEHGLDEELALDDTAYDIPGWISIEVGGVSQAEVHINDLYPAVVAFHAKYVDQKPS